MLEENLPNNESLDPNFPQKNKEESDKQPVQQVQQAPKIKKRMRPQTFLLGILGISFLLLTAFYALVFWGTVSGNVSNPLFETLGIEAVGLKSLLQTMTNTIFGLLALILLFLSLIFLFRGAMTEKDSTNRKTIFAKAGLYSLLFIFICGIWVFFFWFISTLQGETTPKQEDSLINTTPTIVVGLSAPIQINFDIGEKLFKKINPESIRQINWDFDGDNIIDASGPIVTHRFLDKGENNGRFPVTANISYFSEKEGKEVSFLSKREVIISNEAVLASLIAAPSAGPFPLTVEFNALESRDPDGEVILYEWDLDGDGEFEVRQEGPTIEKTFTQVGEYKVQLRVTGSNHDFDVVETLIKVNNPEGSLRAEITSDGPLEGYAPLKLSLDGSNSFVKEGQITRFEWFVTGDTEPFTGRKLQRIFRNPGEYEVSLTIQNDLGERNKITKTIKVSPDNSKASIFIRTTPAVVNKDGILYGVVPFDVSFDSSKSEIRNAFEWQWDFENDGITDEFSQAVKHTFRKAGTYEVKLLIVDSNEKVHEKIQIVKVERSGIRAKIYAEPTAGEVPLRVDFDGSGSAVDEGEIVDYIWEFPNTEPIHYGAKISYLFKTIGNFTVKLTVLTSKGKTSYTETLISIRVPVIKSDFSFTPKIGKAPLVVSFDLGNSKGLVQEYFWDFGDGYTQKQYKPSPITHTYKTPGIYQIKLRLLDENNIIAESTQKIEIK